MHYPLSSTPVLFETRGNTRVWRTVMPLAYGLCLLLMLVQMFRPRAVEESAWFVLRYLPMMVSLVGLVFFFALKLRHAAVTGEGILLRLRDETRLLKWRELDWAEEIGYGAGFPMMAVRVKERVTGAPRLFILLPPHVHRQPFKLLYQPMSEYVRAQVWAERESHPDLAHEYSPWPSRMRLGLVVVALVVLLFAGLFSTIWLTGGWPPGL